MDNKKRLIRILNDYSIEYWTSGKNVSEDAVNVQCPFCSDQSNHCGIFEDTLVFHCWRCSATGPFVRLFQQLTNLTSAECERILDSSDVNFKQSSREQIDQLLNKEQVAEVEDSQNLEIALPEYSELITSKTRSILLDNYLKRRDISFNTILEHNCYICEVGRYMHRMIIPIYYNEKLVCYQAADLTGKADIKYDIPKQVDINTYLYGIDDISTSMILVEGILDAWRLEEFACATFGTHITDEQKNLIEDKHLDTLIFCWDSDAYWKAKKQAKYFEPFINNIKVIEFPKNEDPDSFGKWKTLKLIGKSYELD